MLARRWVALGADTHAYMLDLAGLDKGWVDIGTPPADGFVFLAG